LQKKGLTLVYTGNGKGKTTAAVGLAVRAVGQGLKVGFFQFIKSPDFVTGERIALEKLGVEVLQLGIGFTWRKTPEEHREAIKNGFELVKEKISSDQYDLIILDELNNVLAITNFPIEDILSVQDVLELIKTRPERLHLVLTGRNAKEEIIEAADLVSSVEELKHYYDQGRSAVVGIEY